MFLLVAAVVSLIAFLLLWDTKRPRNFPNGPNWLPIVGNYTYFKQRLPIVGYNHLVLEELRHKYGDVVGLRMGRLLVISVFGPDMVHEVLTREEFEGRPDGFFFRYRTFGKRLGVVFSDGVLWQKQRKFSLQHLRNFGLGRREMELMIQEEARDLMRDFSSKCHSSIQMQHAFDISVLNVLWAMLAGERFALDDSKLITLVQIIHESFKLIDMSGGLLNQMPFLRYLIPNASGFTQINEILQKMFTFLKETIDEHKSTMCLSHSRDFIDAFMQRMESEGKERDTFTDEQLYSICLDLFMAGTDTTSNTLAFSILYMILYPDIQKKVQNEIDDVLGGNRCPNLQDRINLPYTEAVLMEVQRLVNIPPLGIAHRAVKDAVLMGKHVPQGTIILTSLYSVHMDRGFWGDPEIFRPERFLNESGKLQVPEKYFIPFGQGKRRCLGESLAKSSYFIFFTSLLYTFLVEPDPDAQAPSPIPIDGLTLSTRPYSVILKRRHL